MWLGLAFISAFLLGCYEVNKKISLDGNAVIPVLFFNTLISSLIFVPFIFLSFFTDVLDGTMLYVPRVSFETHVAVFIKAVIVLSSWIFGYFALKHLPLTITGPIKATQPVVTLVGAMLVFGERLNLYQWIGVILSIASFYLLSSSGKKEGIRFTHNKWIFFTVLSILTGAASGLYDKHLMGSLDVMTVQVWFNLPVSDDAADPPVPLVSATEKHDAFCLALEHCLYLRLPLRGGLDLFLCPYFPRFDDLYRLDGPPQQCLGDLPCRRFVLP